MLKESLYKVKELSGNAMEGVYSYQLHFLPDNSIFDGHFPNQPVVPGVVIIQIVKEMMSDILGTSCYYYKILQTKFLQVINPNEQLSFLLELKISSQEEIYSIDVVLQNETTIAFKMKAKIKKEAQDAR